MISHYFAPTFRVWYADGLLQRKGLDAWRRFLHTSAAHEVSDMRVRPLARVAPFSVALAQVYAELGKNSGRPPVSAGRRG